MLSAREIITKPVEDLKRSVHLKKEENAERQRSHPQSRCVAPYIFAVQLSSTQGQIEGVWETESMASLYKN